MRKWMQILTLLLPATNTHLAFSYGSPQAWITPLNPWLDSLSCPLWCNMKLVISHIALQRAKHRPFAIAGILCWFPLSIFSSYPIFNSQTKISQLCLTCKCFGWKRDKTFSIKMPPVALLEQGYPPRRWFIVDGGRAMQLSLHSRISSTILRDLIKTISSL